MSVVRVLVVVFVALLSNCAHVPEEPQEFGAVKTARLCGECSREKLVVDLVRSYIPKKGIIFNSGSFVRDGAYWAFVDMESGVATAVWGKLDRNTNTLSLEKTSQKTLTTDQLQELARLSNKLWNPGPSKPVDCGIDMSAPACRVMNVHSMHNVSDLHLLDGESLYRERFWPSGEDSESLSRYVNALFR